LPRTPRPRNRGADCFEIAFPASLTPRTGRAYIAIAKDGTPEPRLQAGELARSTPFFGTDVRRARVRQNRDR